MSQAERDTRSAPEESQTEQQPVATGGETEGGSIADESNKSQEELRRDIETTREDLGDTVDALSQKTDVKAQVKSAADEQKAKLRSKQEELKDKVSGKQEEIKQKVSSAGGEGGPSAAEASERAKDLMGALAERTSRQPLPYLAAAAGVGLVLGLIVRGRS